MRDWKLHKEPMADVLSQRSGVLMNSETQSDALFMISTRILPTDSTRMEREKSTPIKDNKQSCME